MQEDKTAGQTSAQQKLSKKPPKVNALTVTLLVGFISASALAGWAITNKPPTAPSSESSLAQTSPQSGAEDSSGHTEANKAVAVAYPIDLPNLYTETSVELVPGSRVLVTNPPIALTRVKDDDLRYFISGNNTILGNFEFNTPVPESPKTPLPDVRLMEQSAKNNLLVTDSTQWLNDPRIFMPDAPDPFQGFDVAQKKAWVRSLYDTRQTKSCENAMLVGFNKQRVQYIETNDKQFSGCIHFNLSGPQAQQYNPYVYFYLAADVEGRNLLISGNYTIVDDILLKALPYEFDKIPEGSGQTPQKDTQKKYEEIIAAIKRTKVEFKKR